MRWISEYNIFEELSLLFAEMNVLAAILGGAGLLLCIIGICRPTKGVFGGAGATMLAIFIVMRVTDNGSLQMLFLILAIIFVVLSATFLISVRASKYNWLLRRPLTEGSAISAGDDDREAKDYYFLLNHEGVAASVLAPSGYISINNIEFEATAQGNESIAKGAAVRVVEVENEKILVRQVQ